MSGAGANLLDAAFLRRLEQVQLVSRSRIRGKLQGKRSSKELGSSLDFADYRLYAPGDDTRQMDWNAYGRTGKPFIKMFMDEQELQVRMWLDASESMNFGQPGQLTKWEYAKQLAAALGYVSLNRYDRVEAAIFTNRLLKRLGPLRGKGSAARLFEFLAGADVGGSGDIAAVFGNPALLPGTTGMTWLFSDFLYESGVEEALRFLQASRQELVVVQVLSPAELLPQFSGELRLIDSESGAGKEVAVSGRVLKAYRQAVEQHIEGLRSYCFERGIAYLLARTDVAPADFVLHELRKNGLAR